MREVTELPRLAPRPRESHKGDFGRLLVVAGSEGMTGAAILAARAAYRSGAGLVTIGIERGLFASVSPAVPEAIFLDTSSWEEKCVPKVLEPFDALLVGPGLGTTQNRRLVESLLHHWTGALDREPFGARPLVLDADAINVVATSPSIPVSHCASWVWTPHPGEFARLTGEKPAGDAARLESAEKFIRARGGVLVLKGHRTVVMDRERYAVNATGNPGMATAGSGDVLAGMIAALLGQGLSPFDAARLGVHLHGLSGDLAATELGEIPLVASDLVKYLPRAFRRLDEVGT